MAGMSDPIKVVALLTVQPGKGEELLAAWPALAVQVRAEEGCLAYDLHTVVRQPDRFVVLERWASTDALKAHGASAHMKEFGATGAAFMAGRSDVLVLPDVPAV
jgi:quinol monooxygenase YgiN